MNKQSIRRMIAIAAVVIMVVPALFSASMETFPFVAYTKKSVALLTNPKKTAVSQTVLPAKAAVSVTSKSGTYYVVTYEGIAGYLPEDALVLSLADTSSGQASISQDSSTLYAPLTKGSQGEMVLSLQQALKELGFLRDKVDGKFGKNTETAVKAFQKKNKLSENGIADAKTQALLFDGSPLNSRGRKVSLKVVPAIAGLTLRPGDRGQPVTKLQEQLKTLGYYKGKVDGRYGQGTRKAVMDFQKANRLKVDGIAGPKTQEMLGKPGVSSAGASGSNIPLDPSVPTYPYQTTTSSSVNLRKRASIHSMRITTVPEGHTITVNRVSGDYLFIRYNKYSGYVLSKYVNIPEEYLPGKSFKNDTAARLRYETLAQGASGYRVKALQEALQELGFYQGDLDGVFGGNTTEAVRAFQEKNGYKATGIALAEMQKLIYEEKPRNSTNRRVSVSILPPIPNPDMQLGDKGDAVRTLQQTLASMDFYKGKITGEYDRATANAVKAYQAAHSIKATGKMNDFTWRSLHLASSTPPPYDGTPILDELTEENVIVMQRGTRGLAVSRLQERLMNLGYLNTPPDGVYKASDMEAVRAFQRNNGLTSSGIADLYTQRTLYSNNAVAANQTPPQDWQAINTATPAPATATPPPTLETLRIGSNGGAVQALQSRLIDLRFLKGRADGIYGTQTAQAVTAFQKANKLRRDGIAGPQTLAALYAAQATGNVPAPPPKEDTGLQGIVKLGSRGEDVTRLQRILITLKYYSGAADGIYGPKTALAVREFQKRNNLKPDGIVGSLTFAMMHSANAKPATSTPIGPINPQLPPKPSTPSNAFSAPKAREVRFAIWQTEIRPRARQMKDITIYDFTTGIHYNVRLFSFGAHADGEPVTKEDTQNMNKALGVNNWTPRPVWVIFSDGRVYMASTHSRGHEVDTNPNNGLSGHICIHFPRDMEDAKATGPYAVSHQNAILAGWDLTQQMAK